jgi:hypothetical protein
VGRMPQSAMRIPHRTFSGRRGASDRPPARSASRCARAEADTGAGTHRRCARRSRADRSIAQADRYQTPAPRPESRSQHPQARRPRARLQEDKVFISRICIHCPSAPTRPPRPRSSCGRPAGPPLRRTVSPRPESLAGARIPACGGGTSTTAASGLEIRRGCPKPAALPPQHGRYPIASRKLLKSMVKLGDRPTVGQRTLTPSI